MAKSREPAADRAVRVFVSSTFRDMQAERDELVKRVFPQLRKLCGSRDVTWGEVDLRWGITDEQKAEGRVLPVCLEEIRRCRPYFIGLLADRYGWVPEEIAPELVAREPWLVEHRGKSVTELEIVHGVLRDPEMAEHSFFYLRDPAWVGSLPEDQQPAFREEPKSDEITAYGPDRAEERAQERRDKLAELKDRISNSGLPVRTYANPQAAADLILEDLTAVIDRLYPLGSEPDPLRREAAEHEAFAQSRVGVHIGRREYFERLDTHATGDSPPLVVVGEAGSGKSALVANWALAHGEDHRDDLVVLHFTGSSPRSSDWAAIVRRIMGELARRFGIEGEVPDDAEELRAAFANWLHMAAARGRAIVILDALNQLDDRDGAPDLVWLPPEIPANVRLVLSTLPGRPLDELDRRGWPVLHVEPLEPAERASLVGDYLAQYGKELSSARVGRITAADQCANPLFLRVLLEEVRLWGENETLDERIGHYLAAPTVADLYELVLERWQADYERDRPGLVQEAMSLLWAARRGLSEAELFDLLGDDDEPLPAAHWSPFFLAAEQSLGTRAGLAGFAHDYLRQAVQHVYLPTDTDQSTAHQRLAAYFDHRRHEARAVDELPWQLAEAASWERLRDLLVDPEFFGRAWDANEFDIKTYWTRIEANSPLRMVDAYRPVVDQPDAEHAWKVGALLDGAGHLSEALTLRGQLVEHYRRTGDRANLQASLGNQANVLSQRGDFEAAATLYDEEQRICHELGDRAGLARSLGNQANVLYYRGDLDAAMTLHQQKERICRELGDRAGLAVSLGNQGSILRARGDFDAAMSLHQREERIYRELGDLTGRHFSLGNQALILFALGDLDGAIALHQEEERICRELGDRSGLAVSLGNRGNALRARGHLEAAVDLYQEKERICRELGDRAGLARSLGNRGVVLHAWGDFDGAMALHQEEERILRELGDKDGLARSLGNQGNVLRARGDLKAALGLYQEKERICRELGDRVGLAGSLGDQAIILWTVGSLQAALTLSQQQEGICRDLSTPDGLAASLANQAGLLLDMGQPHEALPLAEEAYGLATQHGLVALARQMSPILEDARSRAL